MSKKEKAAARVTMPCPHHVIGCDGLAQVKACKGKKIRGAKHADYYWQCDCHATGYMTEDHFKRYDKAKKISIATA